MKVLIKNGRVIDPSQNLDEKKDILIEKGKIKQIDSEIKDNDAAIIEAEGKIVAPGFIDLHTHLREPGGENAETFETGLAAAITGGFTTVCAMPNTSPSCDTQADARFIIERAKEVKLANVIPVGAITKKREGKELTEMGELKDAGCLSLSDDGISVEDSALMRRALEYASMLDLLVISHCEDAHLAGDGVMHEGEWSTVFGLKPIPSEAESIIVERDSSLAELAGARLHIAHVSVAKSVEAIKHAKKRGVKVTAEVTPHHFSLTDESLRTYNTSYKVNPPLSSASDVAVLKQALKDGTIDVIATDHAPHPANEKEKEFDYAPFGMIGLETALSLAVMNLIQEKFLDWPGLISKLSTKPAEILKYNRGTLVPGSVADIVIIDPDEEWVYTEDKVKSLSKNSPFIDEKMKAKVTDVFVAGKQVLREKKLVK